MTANETGAPAGMFPAGADTAAAVGFAGRLRALAADAAVYGVANVLARALTFLLIPLHTHVLTPAEYGPVGTLYAYIAVTAVVMALGLESAYLRFKAFARDGDGRALFSTPLLFLAVTGLAASLAVAAFSVPLAAAIGIPGHASLVRTAALIVLCDTLGLIPLAHLRIERRAGTYAAIRLSSILVYVTLTLFLLLRVGRGAAGILEANLAASATELLLLLLLCRHCISTRIDRQLLRQMLDFALPLVPAGLATVALQSMDRPLLQWLTDDATVGVYHANAKLAVPLLLLVTMFQTAWQPFFLTRARDPDAAGLFARVLSWQLLVGWAAFLALALSIDLLVALPLGAGRTLLDRGYWPGTVVVPWLLLGYIAFGAYNVLAAGPMVAGKTRIFLWVTGAAAAVDLGLTLVLVPRFGILGAAWGSAAGYGALAVLMWAAARRSWPLGREWRRLVAITACGLLAWTAYLLAGGPRLGLAARLPFLAAYPVGLWLSGCLRLPNRTARVASSATPLSPPQA